jgi:hypothetical protein
VPSPVFITIEQRNLWKEMKERKKIVPTNPDLFFLLGLSKESCKRNQRIQEERKLCQQTQVCFFY